MALLTQNDTLDRLALENRVPSTRDGFIIKVGMKVVGVFDNKISTVTAIDDFWGDSHDVGGFTIFTDAAGDEAEGEEGDSAAASAGHPCSCSYHLSMHHRVDSDCFPSLWQDS